MRMHRQERAGITIGDDTRQTCPACGSHAVLHYKGSLEGTDQKTYRLLTCASCGAGWAFPRPTRQELVDFYTDYRGLCKGNIVTLGTRDELLKANRAIIKDNQKRLELIRSKAHLPQRNLSYVDVGCGNGYSVHAGNLSGFTSRGIDLDPDATSIGADILDLDVIHGDLHEHLHDHDRIDLITMWQVLEHIEDFDTALQQIQSALKKDGGIFAGTVPNYGGIYARMKKLDWYMLCPPEHVNFFTKTSLEKIFLRHGFEVVWIGSDFKSCAPLIQLGIRAKIARLKNEGRISPGLADFLRRTITLIKRYVVYFPVNSIIYFSRLGGNSLFFIVRRAD